MRSAQEVKPALLAGHLFAQFGIVHFYFHELIARLLPFLIPILILSLIGTLSDWCKESS